ncbi:MAG: Mitochondrial presequence protease [Chaenotheca gracillima]|nr:MAG: Mitochondrial presequence protease [Chaenotheca gracillima]
MQGAPKPKKKCDESLTERQYKLPWNAEPRHRQEEEMVIYFYSVPWNEAKRLAGRALDGHEQDWAPFLEICQNLLEHQELPLWYKAGCHLFVASGNRTQQRWHGRKAVDCYTQLCETYSEDVEAKEYLETAKAVHKQCVAEWALTKMQKKAEARKIERTGAREYQATRNRKEGD